jgi:hypothetical protein
LVNPGKNTDFDTRDDLSSSGSPFLLDNETGYRHWRKIKLEHYHRFDPQKVIRISDHANLSPTTLGEITVQLQACNFAFFEIATAASGFSTGNFLTLGRQLGLNRFEASPGAKTDGVTLLSALESSQLQSRYIPFTNRALNWHTDGYYNPPGSRIDAFLLYCVNQAAQGGDNFLLDHEMVYLQIRDTDPDLLVALMDPGVMVVPENIRNQQVLRQAESGPVFMVDKITGRLNMRYSSRPRNISWKTDALSKRAVNRVRKLLVDNEYIARLKLKNGQGIICNNVLHGRKAFVDKPSDELSRLYYRARYYDSVSIRDYLGTDEKSTNRDRSDDPAK